MFFKILLQKYRTDHIQFVDHVIIKRATCDLLSFEIAGVKVNDAACAAHCLALKKKGGHCTDNGVCYCRK